MPGSPTVRRITVRILGALLVAFTVGFIPLPSMTFEASADAQTQALPATTAVTGAERSAQQAAADQPLDADRVTGTATDPGTFTAIGVTLDRQPTDPVMVRVKEVAGGWGDWRQLAVEASEGPDVQSDEAKHETVGTEPIWIDHADAYQVSLANKDAAAAKVVVVKEEQRRVVTDATPVAGASVPPPFGIHSRAEWGARANLPIDYGNTVKLAIVHHSDSSNDYSPADVPAVLRSIQAYHMDGRGWADIAYNFVVDKFGGVWEGRAGGIDQPVIGAHSLGFNTDTVGVMVIGDYTTATPSAAALESVSAVVGWKLALHGVDPAGTATYTSNGSLTIPAGVTVNLPAVVGHQDVGATSCPGSIEGSLGAIRNRAQQWTDWIRATSTRLVSVTGWGTFRGGFDIKGNATSGNGPPAVVQLLVNGTVAGVKTADASGQVLFKYVGIVGSTYRLCLRVVNGATGNAFDRDCVTADVPGSNPLGGYDFLSIDGNHVLRSTGWALDPEGLGPIRVLFIVDGRIFPVLATLPRGGWEVYPFHGPNHGYDVTIPLGPGTHTVCVDIENFGAGSNVNLNCQVVK